MRTYSWIAAVAVLGAALPAANASEDGVAPNIAPWRIVLRDQLKSEKACDLNEVIKFQEIPLGDGMALDGRISCVDGREFDFSRKQVHQKFSIELCQPSVC